MVETRYGVISDVHEDPRVVALAVDVLKREGAEKLLVNGDIGGHYGDLKTSQDYTAFILDTIGKSELESFVQPGSHESLFGYGQVIEHFAGNNNGKYSNIVDCLKMPKVEVEGRGHNLVFLPGSDFLCQGEYSIGSNESIPSGNYAIRQTANGRRELIAFDELAQFAELLSRGIPVEGMYNSNMYDLKKLINDSDKTIVVCHVPRKFDNLENCVDVAEFGETMIDFPLNGRIVERGAVFRIDVARKIAEAGYPVAIKRENRGNNYLRELYEELGVRKCVSGHFHESAHRANDRNGNKVEEGEFVDELFWMASYLDGMRAGILNVRDSGEVSYRNIDLRNYLVSIY